MFTLSERTSRLLCRSTFLFVCAVPAVGIVSTAIVSRTSPYQHRVVQSWEQSLSERLGLAISMYSVSNPHPRVFVIKGLRACDVETGKTVAYVPSIRVVRDGATIDCSLVAPEISGEQFADLTKSLWQRAVTSELPASASVVGHAASLTVKWAGGERTLKDLSLKASEDEAGPTAEITLRIDESGDNGGVSLSVRRNRQSTDAYTTVQIETRATAISCSLLADIVPNFSSLGDRCRFAGQIIANEDAKGWSGVASGDLTLVSLESLLNQRHPAQLAGLAHIRLNNLRFDRNKVIAADGRVDAGDVQIDKAFMQDVIRQFRLRHAPWLAPTTSYQPPSSYYHAALSFGFRMDKSGVDLVGGWTGEHSNVVLCVYDKSNQTLAPTLMVDPLQSRSPTASIAYALHPSLATEEAAQLLSRLPLSKENEVLIQQASSHGEPTDGAATNRREPIRNAQLQH